MSTQLFVDPLKLEGIYGSYVSFHSILRCTLKTNRLIWPVGKCTVRAQLLQPDPGQCCPASPAGHSAASCLPPAWNGCRNEQVGVGGLVCLGLMSLLLGELHFITWRRQKARKGSSAPCSSLPFSSCDVTVPAPLTKLGGRIHCCCSGRKQLGDAEARGWMLSHTVKPSSQCLIYRGCKGKLERVLEEKLIFSTTGAFYRHLFIFYCDSSCCEVVQA